MGRTADKLLGYYYDVNNDGYVNLRDYVLIQRFQAGIGLTQPEPETPEITINLFLGISNDTFFRLFTCAFFI